MTMSARIDDDCSSLAHYFQRLFELIREVAIEEQVALPKAVDATGLESQESYHRISHLIKPDMLINIYSLLDFWLKEICNYQGRKNNLSLSYLDIKGKDDLHAYHKFLTKYVGLDLTSADANYALLQDLREIRNQFIHRGGHLPENHRLKTRIPDLNGIKLTGSLIVINDDFVWDMLACAQKYLCAAANA